MAKPKERPSPEDIAACVQLLDNAAAAIEKARTLLVEMSAEPAAKQSSELGGLLHELEVALNKCMARIAVRTVQAC